jgi:RHS repeat-associated protein
VSYYVHDQLGSTMALVASGGQIASTYDYDAYGALRSSTITSGIDTNFRYAGQDTDPESGLQYLQARYYDPSTSQFLTVDPLASATGEPYGYALGDPLTAIDPSGTWPYSSTGLVPSCVGSYGGVLGALYSVGNCTIQAASWIGAQNPVRRPDYYTIQLGGNTPILGLGAQGGITISRYGDLYWDAGPTMGTPGLSGYVGAGYEGSPFGSAPNCTSLDSYMQAWSLSYGRTFDTSIPGLDPVVVGVLGNGPQLSRIKPYYTPGKRGVDSAGFEVGLGNRQAGWSYTYAQRLRLP